MRIGHVASERTILLTQLDPTGLGGKKGERERKEDSLEREALPSL